MKYNERIEGIRDLMHWMNQENGRNRRVLRQIRIECVIRLVALRGSIQVSQEIPQ